MDDETLNVFVPIEVDVYLNYASTNGVQYNPPRPNPVYLSPIPHPNYAALRLESKYIQHDIFDHVRTPPAFADADPYRVTDRRCGIYLHWSLPATHRVGLAASDGFQNLEAEKRKGGFVDMEDQSSDGGTPIFRQAPNRWIIRRTITDRFETGGGKMQVRQPTATGTDQRWYIVEQHDHDLNNESDLHTQKTVFVIESDQIRKIEDISATEDIEITSSPFVDFDSPVWQQGHKVLGKAYPLRYWQGGSGVGIYADSLTAVRTANPYFADFQPQNSSVFSFFDDLSPYQDGSKWQLAESDVSYSVVGYYASSRKDPLAVPLFEDQTPADRIAACQLMIKKPESLAQSTTEHLANQQTKMNMICHGSFNHIHWSIRVPEQLTGASTLPLVASVRYPGDLVQNAFDTSHPLAIGTNVLEALFAWLDIQDPSTVPADVQAQLLRLQTFVLDINDNLDAQLQAEDLLATNNFVPTACGTRYILKDAAVHGSDFLQDMIRRNEQQARYDSFVRQYHHFKEQMFSLWWTFICDSGKTTDKTTQTTESLKDSVEALHSKMQSNLGGRPVSTDWAQEFKDSIQPQAETPFYMQQDPTLLIAGLQSSWPKNPTGNIGVRLKEQMEAEQDNPNLDPSENQFLLGMLEGKLDDHVFKSIALCWAECDRLSGVDSWENDALNHNSKVNPDYYDRDAWNLKTNDNGWFPLFVEWSVEYYDIPWQYWEFAPYGPEGRIGYRIRDGIDLQALGLAEDCSVFKGRSPILPQAPAILETALKQVFSKVNPDMLATIPELDQDKLFEAVRNMDFLSTTMSGLTDQLVTRMSGTHAIPIRYSASDKVSYVPKEILNAANEAIGMTNDDFLAMDSGSATTPFASLVPVTADKSKYSPFKPVTHGQFRFTKLNIIDKFGQMVQGIKTSNGKLTGVTPVASEQSDIFHTPLFPCLSETYSLEECTSDASLKGVANAVLRRADNFCSFVQLPPSINQPARLNADFVTQKDQQSGMWRQLEDHENPCRGYLVINSANASFQVFTTEGQFVREYSVRNGKIATMPFPPNASLGALLDPLLQKLLDNFVSTDYLIRLFQNISTTIQDVQANPSHVAESMLSILGRPLALVTFGISLELEGPPLINQSTVPLTKSQTPTDSVLGYDFKVKIGDRDNVFDGLYGLFGTTSTSGDFDFNTFYSYHDPDTAKQPSNIALNPFYPDPMDDNYTQIRKQQYKVFAGLIDPFTAVHCYTAILPIKQLKIPPWALKQGVDRIASFFKMGPILSPIDVPPFDPTLVVQEDYRLDDPNRPAEVNTLPIPAVSVADWNWLQPYWEKQADGTSKTQYNLLGIQNVDMKPRYEQPPYVVTEGYLQMKTSFVKSDTNTKTQESRQS